MNTNPNPDALSPGHPHLPADEMRLFDYLDGQSTAPEAQAVRAHLAGCARCQALQKKWGQFDSLLADQLSRASLSAGFAARLFKRIETEPAPALATAELQRKLVNLESEWQRSWTHHRKTFLRSELPSLLDYLGYAVAIAAAGYLLFGLLNHALKTLVSAPAAPLDQLILPIACGIGLSLFFAALVFATKARLWRWLADF